MDMLKPLEGLVVVDCSLGDAGPQASGRLAEYGAEVIWVEPAGGDPFRRRNPAAASVYNRNKRSVVLDPAVPADRDILLTLVERADVFIESWRPEEAEKLGLSFDRLRARNPQIIVCSISGFGTEGPYKELPPYESIVHALLGTMTQQTGHRDGPIYEGLPFAAHGAAQLAVIGILAALYRRLDDGAGRHIETSLWDGALAFHSMFWGETDESIAASRGKSVSVRADLRGPSKNRLVTRSFLCGDGEYIGVHTGAVGAFDRLMKVLGLDDRIPPNASANMGVPLSKEEYELLESSIHDIFASQPRSYWVETLMQADVCAVEHARPGTIFDQPQARHNQMIVKLHDPLLGVVEQVAPGIRFDGQPPLTLRPAPTVGQDSAAIEAPPEKASRWRPRPVGPADTRPLLDGVHIVDLGAYYAGPYSSRLLADLGADVIKLERLQGDQLRGIERAFFSAQAGKRSIAVDLKDPDLDMAARKLIEWADIIHHNMRPGAAERLGLGAEQIRAINDRLIYLYSPGWGATGPHKLRQSFAPLLSGYVGGSYEVAGQYNEPLPVVGNEDPGNGLLGAVGMLLALLVRRMDGHAPYCENPQLNAAMGMVSHIVRKEDGEVIGAETLDVLQMGSGALDSLYNTADGWICLAAHADAEIRKLENLLGVTILDDERFATFAARTENRHLLFDQLRDIFETRTTEAWLELFKDSGVALVRPVEEGCTHDFLNDPLEKRIGRVAEVVHPEKGNVREISHLLRITDAVLPPHRLAPKLGEHTEAVLSDLGYASERLAALRARGSIR